MGHDWEKDDSRRRKVGKTIIEQFKVRREWEFVQLQISKSRWFTITAAKSKLPHDWNSLVGIFKSFAFCFAVRGKIRGGLRVLLFGFTEELFVASRDISEGSISLPHVEPDYFQIMLFPRPSTLTVAVSWLVM